MNAVKTYQLKIRFFCLLALFIPSVSYSGAVITYHGRILDTAKHPVERDNVEFNIRIYSPLPEKCLLYAERRFIDMRDSEGVFVIPIGDGEGQRLSEDPGLPMEKVFSNIPKTVNASTTPNGTFNCHSGSSFTPTALSHRHLEVAFDDGLAGMQTLPLMSINFVPLAVNSYDAQNIGGTPADSVLRLSNGTATPLSPANFTELLSILNGSSSQYAKANELRGATVPTLSNGEVLGWSGGGWVGITPLTSFTEMDPSVQNFAKSALPSCGPNAFLQNDGSGNLVCVAVSLGGSGTVTSVTAGTGLLNTTSPGDPITNTGTLAVNVGTGANQIVQLDGAGKLPAVDGSQLTNLTASTLSSTAVISTSGDITTTGNIAGDQITTSGTITSGGNISVTGTVTASGNIISTHGNIQTNKSLTAKEGLFLYDEKTPTPGSVGLKAPADVPASYILTLPESKGTAGQVLSMKDTTGVLEWITPGAGGVTSVTSANADIGVTASATAPVLTLNSGTTGGATDAGKIVKLDGDGKIASGMLPDIAPSQLNGTLPIAKGGTNSSAALTNNRIMASSGGAIVEAPAITGHRAVVSDANGIPTASVVSETELGYLSGVTSSIQTQLNGKQSAGSSVSTLTGDVTTGAVVAGSATATIADDAVTSAKIDDGTIVGADMNFMGVNTATSSLVIKDSTGRFFDFACGTAGQVATWSISGWTCETPAQGVASTGTAGAIQVSDGSGEFISNNNVVVDTENGRVGIGTTTPAAGLQVHGLSGIHITDTFASSGASLSFNGSMFEIKNNENGALNLHSNSIGLYTGGGTPRLFIDSTGVVSLSHQIQIAGGNPGAGKVLTSDANGLATWETPEAGGLSEVNLASDVTGVLPMSNGGTGATSAGAARQNLGLGTVAVYNVPVTGNAGSSEIVKGDDSRLSDARQPIDNSVTAAKIASGAVTDAKIDTMSATKLTGNIDRARLPTADGNTSGSEAGILTGLAQAIKGVKTFLDGLNVVGNITATGNMTVSGTMSAASLSTVGTVSAGNVSLGAEEIKLATQAETCNTAHEGAIKYSKTTKKLEFCDGSAWMTVTLTPPPPCGESKPNPGIGDVCENGAIWIGTLPSAITISDGKQYMLAPASTEVSREWGPTSDTSGAEIVSSEGVQSTKLGDASVAAIKTAKGSLTNYPAAQYCDDLVFGGHDDWYLPSKSEFAYIYCKTEASSHSATYPSEDPNCSAYGGKESILTGFVAAVSYWVATEHSAGSASWVQSFSSGMQLANARTNSRLVRCVRRF